jgi:ribonuclease HI
VSERRPFAPHAALGYRRSVNDELPQVTIYTDGGCRPNPGPGGWGAVILGGGGVDPIELSGAEAEATNNRMELRAAIEALRFLDEPHRVELVTDSEYLRRGVTEWLDGWRAKGWRTAGKKAVANRDLWQALIGEIARHDITWTWVRGHTGNRWNERADRLASAEIPRPELPVDDPGAVHLFAAVAHSSKRDAGAWAVLLVYRGREKELSGRRAGASANSMHLTGAGVGLAELNRRSRVHLYTASDYLKDGATAWIKGWRARGWTTRDGKPVANRSLWQRLATLIDRHEVHWHVVSRDRLPDEMERAKALARGALIGE